MLCTLKIKLVPSSDQHSLLLETMKRFNSACNYISRIAYSMNTTSKILLQKECYYDVREKFGLSAQMVVRAIGKVAESYKVDRKAFHEFRDTGAIVYDDRIMTFKGLEAVSLMTLDGRILVPIVLGKYHHGMLGGNRVRGQADLVLHDGVFYLMLVVEAPEDPERFNGDYIGVDLGIVNVAVDSEGEIFSGSAINGVRYHNSKLRAKLQSKSTKSAKRRLKNRSKKEQRFARDVNHCISKRIVEKAKALGTGVALEDLKGIRKRTEKTVGKQQRYRQSSWAFFQLRQFIAYKAKIAGVPVAYVHPANTSRTCPECGYVSKENRVSRNLFRCQACGYAAPADNVAATNIRCRAVCQSAERGDGSSVTCKPPALAVGY